jgi:DNA-binding FrmR family transcriptional regulator
MFTIYSRGLYYLLRIIDVAYDQRQEEVVVTHSPDQGDILQLVASCRGALNGLMAELIEGHLRFHVLDPGQKTSPSQLEAADELMAVVKRYLN